MRRDEIEMQNVVKIRDETRLNCTTRDRDEIENYKIKNSHYYFLVLLALNAIAFDFLVA